MHRSHWSGAGARLPEIASDAWLIGSLTSATKSAISGHRPVSLDHLVGAAEQGHWNRKSECFGSLEIDNQLDLRGLLYREIGRLLALENASGKNTGQPVRIRNAAAVTHQSTGVGKRAILEDCGHRVAERQCS